MKLFTYYISLLGKRIGEEIEIGVEKFLPKRKNIKYLDCGCDDGSKSLLRAQKIGTTKILGLEIENSRIIKARKNGLVVRKTDLNKKWEVKGNSIDCITATEVIEHTVDVDNFLLEARRVLKKGGKIIISTENLASYHNIFALMLGNQPYTGPYLSRIYPIGHRPHAKYYKNKMNKTMFPHLNVMTLRALEELLTKHGFKIIDSRGIGFYPLPFPVASVFSNIDKYHASYCIVSAEK